MAAHFRARTLVSSGSSFEADVGYSRAVAVGEHVFVSGTTGFDYTAMTIDEDPLAQARQTLRNIDAALRVVGATLADVVRCVYMVQDAADFPPCWPALREAFGETRPTSTLVVVGLADPRMKIEIEATAIRGAAALPVERRSV